MGESDKSKFMAFKKQYFMDSCLFEKGRAVQLSQMLSVTEFHHLFPAESTKTFS